jgi:NitT/TauT family transport system ATP-binding protein
MADQYNEFTVKMLVNSLEIKNLTFAYYSGRRQQEIFRNFSLRVADKEFCCIVGPSGCGKTTLLNIIAGFEQPLYGEIWFNQERLSGISYERAMVFQEDAVFPWLNVYKNIEYGLLVRHVPSDQRKELVTNIIKTVGLIGFEKTLPRELSGGMKKRVDLARVLVHNPKLLLMDEPFGSLDTITKEKLQEELIRIWEQTRKTILFVTHDIEEAIFLGDTICFIHSKNNSGQTDLFPINLPRPRSIDIKETFEFHSLRKEINNKLKQEQPS